MTKIQELKERIKKYDSLKHKDDLVTPHETQIVCDSKIEILKEWLQDRQEIMKMI